jgi:hypothetical protein
VERAVDPKEQLIAIVTITPVQLQLDLLALVLYEHTNLW